MLLNEQMEIRLDEWSFILRYIYNCINRDLFTQMKASAFDSIPYFLLELDVHSNLRFLKTILEVASFSFTEILIASAS